MAASRTTTPSSSRRPLGRLLAAVPQRTAGQATAEHAGNRVRVVRIRQRYEQVQKLKAEGMRIAAIQRELRLAPGTARRYFHATSACELVAGTLAGWPSMLDACKPYHHQRWNEGCTNIWQLHNEVKALGFRGSSAENLVSLLGLRMPGPVRVVDVTSAVSAGNLRRYLTRPAALRVRQRAARSRRRAARISVSATLSSSRAYSWVTSVLAWPRLRRWPGREGVADLPGERVRQPELLDHRRVPRRCPLWRQSRTEQFGAGAGAVISFSSRRGRRLGFADYQSWSREPGPVPR